MVNGRDVFGADVVTVDSEQVPSSTRQSQSHPRPLPTSRQDSMETEEALF